MVVELDPAVLTAVRATAVVEVDEEILGNEEAADQRKAAVAYCVLPPARSEQFVVLARDLAKGSAFPRARQLARGIRTPSAASIALCDEAKPPANRDAALGIWR